MGIRMSHSNSEMVDWMVDVGQLDDVRNEVAMRLVDRGRFVPAESRVRIYDDTAWRATAAEPHDGTGLLHLSAPSIYVNSLEHLSLQSSMSFLNIGSGTGYLSTVAGFLLGVNGINHGVELHPNLVDYAQRRVDEMLRTAQVALLDWCVPSYFCGNAFQLRTEMRYDRIYIGAGLREGEERFFCRLLKLGGRIVVPVGNDMRLITAMDNDELYEEVISQVVFGQMIQPNENARSDRPVEIVGMPLALIDICQGLIRRELRNSILDAHPIDLEERCARGRCVRLAVRLDRLLGNTKRRMTMANQQLQHYVRDQADVQTLDQSRQAETELMEEARRQLDQMAPIINKIHVSGTEEMETLREMEGRIDLLHEHSTFIYVTIHPLLRTDVERERIRQRQADDFPMRARPVVRDGEQQPGSDDGEEAGADVQPRVDFIEDYNEGTLVLSGKTIRDPTRWNEELRDLHRASIERVNQMPLPEVLRHSLTSHE